MREAFALQKLLTFFQQKYCHISDINVWNFNETLTNDAVSFEQPGPVELFEVRNKQNGQNNLMSIICTGAMLIQSNFSGSNTFGTMKICSRQE